MSDRPTGIAIVVHSTIIDPAEAIASVTVFFAG